MAENEIDNPCDVCKQEVVDEFTVSKELWEEVTGQAPYPDGSYADGYWCLYCFLKTAQLKKGDCDFPIMVHLRGIYSASQKAEGGK